MKRIVSLVLALCMLVGVALSLTACSQTPEEMVTKAVAKTNELDDYAGKMKILMSMKMSGQEMEVNMISNMKVQNATGDDVKTQVDLEMELLGSKIRMTSYSDKEWVYMISSDGNYKQKITEDADEINQMDSIIKDLPDDLFEGIEVVKEEDGTNSVTIEIPDDVFNDIYEELLKTVTENLSTADVKVQISDAVVKINVKDDLISTYDITFAMTMVISGVTATVDVTASCEFTQYGGVSVELPAGCENFVEMM